MSRVPACALCVLAAAGFATAQSFADCLARARECLDRSQWQAALEALSAARERRATDEDVVAIAAALDDVGRGCHEAGAIRDALRAFHAALELRQDLHGDADHADVASSLDAVATCEHALGKSQAALPRGEAALAMRRRLYGDVDRADIANNLQNIATCLESLGRHAEALPRHEAGLAMQLRLAGSQDDAALARGREKLARCLLALGRAAEALPHFEAALAMQQRVRGDVDHADLAAANGGLGGCLYALGRVWDALQRFEVALAMRRRLIGERDHAHFAIALNNVALALDGLGRVDEALAKYETALAMYRRLYGGRDHAHVAIAVNNVARCLCNCGRFEEALERYEEAVRMLERLHGDRGHPDLVIAIQNEAACLRSLGRFDGALRRYAVALAMQERLFPGTDHPYIASVLDNLGSCLSSIGRNGEALARCEAALAMNRRLYGDRAHPDVAQSLRNVAGCLKALGRAKDGLMLDEEALALCMRIHGDRDHPDVAEGLNSVGVSLLALDRFRDALPMLEAASAMLARLHSGDDHPRVAQSLSTLSYCLRWLGRGDEALAHCESALAMRQRLNRDGDHPDTATSLNNVADCLEAVGRVEEGLARSRAALDMQQRVYGEQDHAHIAGSLSNVAHGLHRLRRDDEALRTSELAVAMIERLREEKGLSAETRQAMFDQLKEGAAYERFQFLAVQAGRGIEALQAAERSRARALLDLLTEAKLDPLEETVRLARARGDESLVERLLALHEALRAARAESDGQVHELASLAMQGAPTGESATRRTALLERAKETGQRLRRLVDEQGRIVTALPLGRPCAVSEIGAALRPGEVLLEFTLSDVGSVVYVVHSGGEVEALPLPGAESAAQRLLPAVAALVSRAALAPHRGRDPEPATSASGFVECSREMFASLIPVELWQRLRTARRVFVSPHRALHRLPFESLVVDANAGKPVYWLDAGPPLSYVPSGSALHWLRNRATGPTIRPADLDLLVIGDPGAPAAEMAVPEHGAFVVAVSADGQGARLGLLPGDVLVRYDDKLIADQGVLETLRKDTEAAIADGERVDAPIPLEVWRAGQVVRFLVQRGPIGVQCSRRAPPLAYESTFDSEAQMHRIARNGDLERIRGLPQLRGAAAEARAIAAAWAKQDRRAKCLLGAEATEGAVFDLANGAEILHFACHGIAEEYAGQSLSMLVLSQPQLLVAEDDGLLKLGDLVTRWRGRLGSCRLVVLSACRTNVGPTLRDDAPQAMPVGFLFAGAPAVISSLWAVDDASTKELMTDFYVRVLAGETDALKAFTDARKALRAKYPDPFHWAPFLYIGAPE